MHAGWVDSGSSLQKMHSDGWILRLILVLPKCLQAMHQADNTPSGPH
jgi:hypothetical protein